ncbi:MAG TPA: RDD family protein [Actinomycetota bacterium]|nr:RDD family protein [Actinomycetota bacterium]
MTGEPDAAGMEGFVGGMIGLQFRMMVIFTVLATVYYVVCHATIGKSPGKMALGLKVVRADGDKLGWSQALKRAIPYPAAYIVPGVGGLIALLNGLWPLWDQNRQSLGDKIAGTLVVFDED